MKFIFAFCFILIAATSMSQSIPSTTKSFALRIGAHQDVKNSILEFAKQNHLKAACIVSAVGSLEQTKIRYANQETGNVNKGYFEIVSLTGTFSESSCHIHLSVSDSNGVTTGGHLLEGNLVYTTLELVITELTEVEFSREKDLTYGYLELAVKARKKTK